MHLNILLLSSPFKLFKLAYSLLVFSETEISLNLPQILLLYLFQYIGCSLKKISLANLLILFILLLFLLLLLLSGCLIHCVKFNIPHCGIILLIIWRLVAKTDQKNSFLIFVFLSLSLKKLVFIGNNFQILHWLYCLHGPYSNVSILFHHLI